MVESSPNELRVYGFAIINELEPALRDFISNEVLLIKYGSRWLDGIPLGVQESVKEKTGKIDFQDPAAFLENTDFDHLKEISTYKDNFELCKSFYGDIGREKYEDIMDTLYSFRIKIAHTKRTFTQFDFQNLLESVLDITKGKNAEAVMEYVELKEYTNFKEIPKTILDQYESKCVQNLPSEDYDLEGGFVGRNSDIRKLKKLLYSDQDRVITIIGSGGVGKTAVALKTAYSIYDDKKNLFSYIIWFSAKINRLSYEGIVDVAPQIDSIKQLMTKILEVILPDSKRTIILLDTEEKMQNYLFNILKDTRILLVIDNLETIINDEKLSRFIQEIPRQATILITSRIGIGEIERRFPLNSLEDHEAITLFRLICKDKNLNDLLKLKDVKVMNLLKYVHNYPLAIKWSLGQVALGKTVEDAFNLSLSGKSDIAKFCFQDVFKMLGINERKCLYGIVLSEEPPSHQLLSYITRLNGDKFEGAIRKLILTSFILPIHVEYNDQIKTNYSILPLTRDFVINKLEEEKSIKNEIENSYSQLKMQPEYIEKAHAEYTQTQSSIGAKTLEDNIALTIIRRAVSAFKLGKTVEAEKLYKEAISLAPTLPYGYIAYARFEFKRGNHGAADKIMETASNIDPNNFNIWYSWGIMKKRSKNISSAKKYLLKAQDLEPDNPSLLNDLGRVYTFEGDYEKADSYFKNALKLKQKQQINYRHVLITYEYMSDNFRRWSQQYIRFRDYTSSIQKLNGATSFILEARKIDPNDIKLLWLEKKIEMTHGMCLCYQGKFKDGEKFLRSCITPVTLSNMKIVTNSEIRARVYYYLAKFGSKNGYMDWEIETLINKGLAVVPNKSNFRTKLESMLVNFGRFKEQKIKCAKDSLRGIIIYYNMEKKYGFISANDEKFFFNIRNFSVYVNNSQSLLYSEIIFVPQTNTSGPNRLATQIRIL